jgi:putative glutamine amidotransferase
MPLPNLGENIDGFIQNWGVNGFIFTGGDDWGRDQMRDLTETTIMGIAEEKSFPLFGVCRGLQAMQLRAGGTLAGCRPGVHRAKRHRVQFLDPAEQLGADCDERIVNSFHENAIASTELAGALEALAVSEDGLVEAAAHRSYPQIGVMWHPEREELFHRSDLQMIRTLFHFDISE